MGSLPALPALDVKPPQVQDPLQNFARLVQLRQAVQAQQLQQGQMQLQQGQIEEQQMSLASQKGLMRAYTEAQGDPDKTMKLASKYGVLPKDLLAANNQFLEQKMKTADLVAKQGDLAKRDADLMQGAHDTVMAAAPQDRPREYQTQLAALSNQLYDKSHLQQLPPQYPGDDVFNVLGAATKGHTQQVEEELKKAQTGKEKQQELQSAAETARIQAEMPGGAMYAPSDNLLMQRAASGDPQAQAILRQKTRQEAANAFAKVPAEVSREVQVATNPAVQAGKEKVAGMIGEAQAQRTINTKRQETSDTQFQTAIGADERLNRMETSYKDAVENHNQQAMLALLTDHIGMTLGLQKGARITKDIINEAARSQPWLASLKAKFDRDGYLSGVNLSPGQMRQMLDLGYTARENAWSAARSTANMYGVNPPPNANQVYNQRQPGARAYNQQGGQTPTGTPGYTRIQASDGSVHDIPSNNIDKARQRDPGLKVIQ